MNSRFVIYCCSGSGGLFVSSVFAKLMGIATQPKISDTGNCHDLGSGNWLSIPQLVLASSYWDMNYRSDARLLHAHELPTNFKHIYPDIKVVYITASPAQYKTITKMFVKKAWSELWTFEEYSKWVGPDYPPYSVNNIAESELICNDLVNDLVTTTTKAWFDRADIAAVDYTIDFETVMGLNDQLLDQLISDIVQQPTTKEIAQYVQDYQRLNQQLYFNNQ
jgi:hypothetical protein